MRSDKLKRHMRVHIIYTSPEVQTENSEEICKDIVNDIVNKMFEQNAATERKHDGEHEQPTRKRKLDGDVTEDNHPTSKIKCNVINIDALRKSMEEQTAEYDRKLALGKAVDTILGEGEVKQSALSKDLQEALDLYRNEDEDYDLYKDTELYKWQQELLEKINKKSHREVIWIVGEKTNEGKSYFQKYVKAMYGTSRVVSGINLKASSKNICHALTKQPLATADIFLFNLGKSKKNFENVNYEMLEDLKDGDAFTEKYDSQKLKIKTPNIVMVFSNYRPRAGELALDRWKVFDIVDDHLEPAIPVDNKVNHCWITKKKKK